MDTASTHKLANAKQLLTVAAGLCALIFSALVTAEPTTPKSTNVALHRSGAGTLEIAVSAAGVDADFMLDTGASMVTLSSSLFNSLRSQGAVLPVRQVAARLANNKIALSDVYEIQSFTVNGCELGPLEAVVIEGGKRNLLGLNALESAAPFSISLSPLELQLSHCQEQVAMDTLQASAGH